MKKLINPRSLSTIMLAKLCRHLPHSVMRQISYRLGDVLYFTRLKRRREAEKAYKRLCELASLNENPKVLTRRFFRNQFLLMTAQFVLLYADQARWKDAVEIHGLDAVLEALKLERGVILCTMHFGTNLLTLSTFEQYGHKLIPMRPAFMKEITSQAEREMLFIHRGGLYVSDNATGLASPLREGMRLLKQNCVVAIALDGDQGGGLMQAPFFSSGMPLRLGALELARLTGSPMVFALGVHDRGKYIVRYWPVHYLPENREDRAASVNTFLKETMKHFEELVRDHPDCAWWTRPLSEAVGIKKNDAGRDSDESED